MLSLQRRLWNLRRTPLLFYFLGCLPYRVFLSLTLSDDQIYSFRRDRVWLSFTRGDQLAQTAERVEQVGSDHRQAAIDDRRGVSAAHRGRGPPATDQCSATQTTTRLATWVAARGIATAAPLGRGAPTPAAPAQQALEVLSGRCQQRLAVHSPQ